MKLKRYEEDPASIQPINYEPIFVTSAKSARQNAEIAETLIRKISATIIEASYMGKNKIKFTFSEDTADYAIERVLKILRNKEFEIEEIVNPDNLDEKVIRISW